jgi:hypothetical protein
MTHCDQLLQVLSDGRPHDHRQLYALGMIVHSRISDLRRRGVPIVHWRENGTSFYQLGRELTEREQLVSQGQAAPPDGSGESGTGNPRPRSVSSWLCPECGGDARDGHFADCKLAGTGSETRRPLGSTTVRVDTATPLFDGVPVPAEIVGQLSLEAA